MKRLIYADNAATTKLDIDAFEAMKPYLLNEYGNASQPYSFARSAKKALKVARETIAECIGALPEEIYFTSGGTESNNWAIKGSAFADENKRSTITSEIEHHAVLNACRAFEKLGYPVAYLPADTTGTVAADTLNSFITNKTRLVSVIFANNEIGSIQPIQDLCLVAHEHGALFHTDAVQAVGHIKIDVNMLEIDMLSASAHKFNGPKGIGFLYIRKGTRISSFNDGGSQEFGMRAGTENVASIVGMAVSLKKSCDAMAEATLRLINQEKLLLDGLKGIAFRRNGSTNHIPGNISLSFPGFDGETILHRMDLCGISISTGSACDSVNTQISHVLKAIALDEVYAKGTIRVSLGTNNTDEDAIEIAKAFRGIVK
jgi:cysteine desulfurase